MNAILTFIALGIGSALIYGLIWGIQPRPINDKYKDRHGTPD